MPSLPGTRDLVGAGILLVALSRLVDLPAAWLMAGLALIAMLLGTLQVLGEDPGPGTGAGVPVEALVVPALAAVVGVGVLRLVPVGLWLVPALAALAWLQVRIVLTEGRIARSASGPSGADRTAVLTGTIGVAFLGFVGVAALVPGGLPEPGGTTAPGLGGPATVAVLAAADALVAALVAYRIAALRTPVARDAAWFALTAAIVIATAAGAFRLLEVPRLLGPALLTLVVFLWDAVHGAPATRRRDVRWIWETALLGVLGFVVLAWSLGARP